ncbi:hypothetical protein E6P78_04160 [Streptomyces sp. A0958]|nr:hypothetical protein E6P78_04160 [Streptomyces sp. A0958]
MDPDAPYVRVPAQDRQHPVEAARVDDPPGQDLTTAGDYIEMTSRLTEPVLLGLAALAIRGRVKRGN